MWTCLGLNLGVTEELADHRQTFAQREGAGRERVPEVMQANAVKAGTSADAVPGIVDVVQVGALLPARKHPRVAGGAREARHTFAADDVSGTMRAPVLLSGSRISPVSKLRSPQRSPRISLRRHPVSTRRRIAAAA